MEIKKGPGMPSCLYEPTLRIVDNAKKKLVLVAFLVLSSFKTAWLSSSGQLTSAATKLFVAWLRLC